jgi:hypothetical protein
MRSHASGSIADLSLNPDGAAEHQGGHEPEDDLLVRKIEHITP